MELGVYSPYSCNNTYKFYHEGHRGVLVEADTTKIETIILDRPEDVVLNIGVGLKDNEKCDFYILDNDALNTFDFNEAMNRENKGHRIVDKRSIEIQTINKIINDNFLKCPDLLSIDIEGLDLPVLKSLDYIKYPIPIICAETCKYSTNHVKDKELEIIDFMINIGYFVYADTYINTIFVNKGWFLKD